MTPLHLHVVYSTESDPRLVEVLRLGNRVFLSLDLIKSMEPAGYLLAAVVSSLTTLVLARLFKRVWQR